MRLGQVLRVVGIAAVVIAGAWLGFRSSVQPDPRALCFNPSP
jgi:hypothetical protein